MRKSKLMKALLVFGMSAVTATSIVGFAACDTGEEGGTNGGGHEHTYDTAWTTDPTHHWHEPTCGDTEEKGSYGAHVNEDNDAYCDVCRVELQHTFETEWTNGPNGHWHEPTCDHTTDDYRDVIAHVDEDKNNICDVCGFVGAMAEDYESLSEKENATIVLGETFFAQNKKLPVFSTFGTAGVYTVADESVDTAANYVNVSNGIAKHVTNGKNVGLLADFGADLNNCVVEGYVEIKPTAMGSKWSLITFYDGTQNSEKAGKCDDTNRVFALTTTDKGALSYTLTSNTAYQPSATEITPAADELYKIYYKFDLTTGRVTVTVNSNYVVNNANLGISKLSGYQLISSKSGERLLEMDNIITITREATIDDYKDAVKSDIDKIETVLPESLKGSEAKTAADTALTSATTKEACDTAYAAYNTAVVAAYKGYVNAQIDANYNGKYTLEGLNKEAYTTAKATLDTALADSGLTVNMAITAYGAFVDAVANLHNDDYYNSSSTTFTLDYIVDGSATGTTKTLKLYAEDTLTKAALDKALGLSVDKKVVAWYTSAETQDETTLVEFGNKHDTYATALYAVIAENNNILEVAKVAANTVLDDFFEITDKVKTENGNKMAVVDGTPTYAKQVSLTSGGASTTANSIKFVVPEGGVATVKVVAGQKSDKSVSLAVLNASGTKLTPSDLKINDAAATAFDTLPKATENTVMPNTYTFTLSAGTYYIGGSGGGAYLYELNVLISAIA